MLPLLFVMYYALLDKYPYTAFTNKHGIIVNKSSILKADADWRVAVKHMNDSIRNWPHQQWSLGYRQN